MRLSHMVRFGQAENEASVEQFEEMEGDLEDGREDRLLSVADDGEVRW